MNNIAIFVSGAGEATQRIVKLFNEGNRVKTVLIVTDSTDTELEECAQKASIEFIRVSEADWKEKSLGIAGELSRKEVKLIVLDGFDLAVSDELMEATQGELIRVSSPELAPREVVDALEKDLRKPREEVSEEPAQEETPTPESEWADALKIQFTPPKVPSTPPEVPKGDTIEEIDVNVSPERERQESFQPRFDNGFNFNRREERERKLPEEPMPSTWLIWSILVTIFCCFIPGIIAIIFSSQVSARYYSGDLEGAKRSSRAAEIWIIVSVVVGVVAATLYFPFMFL